MCKTKCSFEKFQNAFNLIYTVCAMLEIMIKTMFAIVSMMRTTGVEISYKPKCVKQTVISKSFKTLSIWYTLCAQCCNWWFKLCLP